MATCRDQITLRLPGWLSALLFIGVSGIVLMATRDPQIKLVPYPTAPESRLRQSELASQRRHATLMNELDDIEDIARHIEYRSVRAMVTRSDYEQMRSMVEALAWQREINHPPMIYWEATAGP